MFDTAEGWYSWVGVSFVVTGLLAVVLGLPTAPPPDARTAAIAVDGVVESDYAGRTTVDIDATRIRLTTQGVTLDSEHGTAHATFEAGPIVPVHSGPLAAVLDGANPRRVFAGPESYATAVKRASARRPAWQPAPETIHARKLTWGETRVTLVG
ncbi:MAG: hypothetical protein U5K28_13305 [Halobacteriales archaeon]|nr:hypothetical protein [Halobacteriales archaeon]